MNAISTTDVISRWFQSNTDLIYFVYGLAFLAMGLGIFTQKSKQVKSGIFLIADMLWLLGFFGILHGLAQLMSMWLKIKGTNLTIERITWFFSFSSFILLFEFGRQLVRSGEKKCLDWRAGIAASFKWWLTPAFLAITIIIGLLSDNFWNIAHIWAQYLFGFLGGLLVGAGLSFYYKCERSILEPLNIRKQFITTMITFIAFALLSGLVVQKSGNFFLPNTINAGWFLNTFKVPVEVFLALCGLISALAFGDILNVFLWGEKTKQLHLDLEQAKELARMDSLTGVANIRTFNEIAAYEVNRCRRYKHPISIAYLDVDNFKHINDTFGHSTGNTLLSIVANIIYNNIRVTDIVSRLGGDEFSILCTETGPEQAKAVIYKVQKLLFDAMQKNGWPVTFSIGLVTYINPPNTMEEMIKAADELMYSAKRNGKNQLKFEIYDTK